MLYIALGALAHDGSKHKGRLVKGEITSINPDGLDLKTTAGTVRVTLTKNTKIEKGNDVTGRNQAPDG